MKKLIPTIGAITGLLIGMPCLNAGGPELKIERSVKVSFDSEVGKSYNAYSTTDVAKQKWELLGGPADGTGDKIVFFYQSDDEQKVFFKVDEADGSGGGETSVGVDHEWSGTSLRLKKANGQWGKLVDLKGAKGESPITDDPNFKNKIILMFNASVFKYKFEGLFLELIDVNADSDLHYISRIETKANGDAKHIWPTDSNGVTPSFDGLVTYDFANLTTDHPVISFHQTINNIKYKTHYMLYPDGKNDFGEWFGTATQYHWTNGVFQSLTRIKFKLGSKGTANP